MTNRWIWERYFTTSRRCIRRRQKPYVLTSVIFKIFQRTQQNRLRIYLTRDAAPEQSPPRIFILTGDASSEKGHTSTCRMKSVIIPPLPGWSFCNFLSYHVRSKTSGKGSQIGAVCQTVSSDRRRKWWCHLAIVYHWYVAPLFSTPLTTNHQHSYQYPSPFSP